MYNLTKMNKNERLETISEYAKRVGVSRQSVYQKIKKKDIAKQLKNHIIVTNGVKYLDQTAIDLLESIQNIPNEPKESTSGGSVIENDVADELKTLREENAKLKDELLEKSNKYETVLEQLVLAQKQIQEKESQLIELKQKVEQAPEPPKETPESEKKHKGLFARLFSR